MALGASGNARVSHRASRDLGVGQRETHVFVWVVVAVTTFVFGWLVWGGWMDWRGRNGNGRD